MTSKCKSVPSESWAESPLQSQDSLPTPERQITLQVGSEYFTTRAETLQESGFFAALLSGRWPFEAEYDDFIFIDADPELFVHILRYLRRGVLPIFFDKVKGHDHALYNALLEEARYFQISRLETWLSDSRYLQAVNVVYSAVVVSDPDQVRAHSLSAMGIDEEINCVPHWKLQKVYICPRGIVSHKGNSAFCGRKCRNEASNMDTGGMENEEVLEILMVRKKILFNHDLCVEGR